MRQTPVAAFLVVNIVAVPIAGRLAWRSMEALEAQGDRFGAVMLSLAVAAAILGANVLLIRWATRAGLPKVGQMVLWGITGLTFALTIGAGFFSPLNLIAALMA